MQFHNYLAEIAGAVRSQNGDKLGSLMSLDGPHIPLLLTSMHDSSRSALSRYVQSIITPWGDIAIAHIQVVVNADDVPEDAFKEQDALVNQHFLSRYFKDATSWVLPALYVLLKDLRRLAERADSVPFRSSQASKMEDAARTCNKAFSICMSDRNPVLESRRWGSYYLAGLVMKCYFKIQTISLSRNIIRALKSNPEVPALEQFPKLHQLTYRYYVGLLSFLNEEYQQADEDLTFSFHTCHWDDLRNQERILTYLVPLRILRGQIPSDRVLSRFPALLSLYSPFITAVRKGDLSSYDAALNAAEGRLFRLGIWYIWEKVRDICLRGLFRRVWVASDHGTRIPMRLFHAALVISGGEDVCVEEAECLVANMVAKGYIRGYISHEKQMVVLAAKNAFPKLRDRPTPFA
ncbi:hypothetical protein K439DRAFT_1656156 [Ramaria rubella]|nr:hypothetical protein K439DRAFT_1656156 [Ramaria rubella]